MKILAMENSTMSAKAMLYNTDTGKSSVMTKRYEEMHSDTTLHDPEAVFQKMMEVGLDLQRGSEDRYDRAERYLAQCRFISAGFYTGHTDLSLVKHGGIKNQQKIS